MLTLVPPARRKTVDPVIEKMAMAIKLDQLRVLAENVAHASTELEKQLALSVLTVAAMRDWTELLPAEGEE